MKNRFLASIAVLFFLFGALAYASDQDKDKNKTSPPPKKPVTAEQKPKPTSQSKPASAAHQNPASTPHQGSASTPQMKPTPAPHQKPASAPQHQISGNPQGSNSRVSNHGTPNSGGQGAQHGQQSRPVMRHVTTQELHQRMRAPVSREVLVRERDHYHHVELARFKMRGPFIRLEPRHRTVLVNLRVVPGTYYHRRAVFYETYGYVPPVYIYNLRPSYGLWCATFLAFMLDRIVIGQQYEYSLMYYNHMREPEFMQWRQEMNGLAAENAELREKLADLDSRVSRLEGTPRNPAYVPEEAGDVALSSEVIDKFTSGTEKY